MMKSYIPSAKRLAAEIAQKDETIIEQAETIKQADVTLENILADARAGLVPTPVQGEEWDKAKRYIAGDLVMSKGVAYIAERFSQGEPPVDNPKYWMVKPDVVTYPLWSSLPEGLIEKGQKCTHIEKNWNCYEQHFKSGMANCKPGYANSKYWEEIISLEVRKA